MMHLRGLEGRRPHSALEAAIAGRENVVAGTDYGLGGRVHADLMQGVVLSEN